MADPDVREPLDAESLRAAALTAELPWQRLDVVADTGSTNADLLARAAAGEDIAGAVLLAEFQSAGRGRHGRIWVSPAGAQIAMSVGVDVGPIPPDLWGWLPLLTGVALVDALADVCAVQAGLKWPNDVLVGSDKLAGILAEVASPSATVVVGLGLNVSLRTDELPVPEATSLSLLGVPDADRTALAAAALRHLGARILRWRSAGGSDPELDADYRLRSLTIGTTVSATMPGDNTIVGVARGVDASGRLLIDDGSAVHAVSAGDITHLRPGSAQ